MSMQQLEMAGWHNVPRMESWLRCGCAPVYCVLENRRKGRHLGLCPAFAGGKSSVRHHHVTFYSSLGLLQQGKTTVALPAQA